jgi:hypothetical protein
MPIGERATARRVAGEHHVDVDAGRLRDGIRELLGDGAGADRGESDHAPRISATLGLEEWMVSADGWNSA